MENIIAMRRVSFAYHREPVLDEIDFAVPRDGFVCLTGANGTGKSTLLRLLLGELAAQSGRVELFGEPVARFRGWPRIGYVPQNAAAHAAAFPATAQEIVSIGLYGRSGFARFPGREGREQVRRALGAVGMLEQARRPVGELSGGQAQRVLLARALAGQPELLLLDEPTTGVDARSSDALYELLHTLHQQTGLSVVLVTHDMARAVLYMTGCYCLEHGNLLKLGPDQIAHELSHRHIHPEKPCGGEANGDAAI